MTVTSKEVAEMLGKRHDNLLRARGSSSSKQKQKRIRLTLEILQR